MYSVEILLKFHAQLSQIHTQKRDTLATQNWPRRVAQRPIWRAACVACLRVDLQNARDCSAVLQSLIHLQYCIKTNHQNNSKKTTTKKNKQIRKCPKNGGAPRAKRAALPVFRIFVFFMCLYDNCIVPSGSCVCANYAQPGCSHGNIREI